VAAESTFMDEQIKISAGSPPAPLPSQVATSRAALSLSDASAHAQHLATRLWTLAGLTGAAATAFLAQNEAVQSMPIPLPGVVPLVGGAIAFLALRPMGRARTLFADRPRVDRLNRQIQSIMDGERAMPLKELLQPGEDEVSRLSQLVHDLATDAVSTRQRSRILHRHLDHSIKNETRKATADLQKQATTDPLTGLGNRRALEERVSRMSGPPTVPGQLVTVMAIDLDHFKSVNDGVGHAAGDQCLQFLAELLKSNLRRDDLAIRIGGDEFLVLVSGCGTEQVRTLAMRLSSLFNQMPWSHRQVRRPTLSVGLASQVVQSGDELTKLLRRADAALYSSKQAGRALISACGERRAVA